MEEKELISQLQLLRTLKPRKDWAILTKNRILAQEQETLSDRVADSMPRVLWQTFIFGQKFAFGRAGAATFAFVVIMGIFGFVQNSTPGDALYSVKKAVIQGETSLLSGNPAEMHLKTASASVRALKEAAINNDTDKLAPALQEYQESLSKAVSVLGAKNEKEALKITSLVNQLEKDSKEVEAMLNTDLYSDKRRELAEKTLEETENLLAVIIERELQSLSSASLTDEQEGLFDEAQSAFAAGDYITAMEAIIRIGNIR